MNGTIKRVVADKGFGFITDFNEKEYFFHKSDININWSDVLEGQKVSFEEVESRKGPRAERVRVEI